MKSLSPDCGLFFELNDTFSKDGFNGNNRDHPLMLELEEKTETNNQFFYIADVIQLKILFTSKQSTKMIGMKRENIVFIIIVDTI